MGSIEVPLNDPVDIPEPTTLTVIRTGKLKSFGSLSVKSGIYKEPRSGRLYVDKVGLPDDEHDLTFHGGPDKAIHQYCSDHYPLWRELYPSPDVSARFVPGGFGENLVADGWNEQNVCIGDRVRIGPADSLDIGGDNGCLLEVSLPRQPCYKLNQKFGIKNFAPRTHQLARTGWYYRVVEEGSIEKGMEIRVIERPYPKWTIERLHCYVHKDRENWTVLEELVQAKEMGMECRGVFEQRLKKRNEEGTEKKKEVELWRDYKLVEKRNESQRTVALVLEPVDQITDATRITPGSFSRIKLPNGLIRPYSVVTGTTGRFELGVAREESGRGGSVYIHDNLRVGDIVSVGNITYSLKVDNMGSNHILVAGGIGITAVIDIAQTLAKIQYAFELHYAVRTAEDVAFQSTLEPLGEAVTIYDRSKGERMDIQSILKNRKWNSHVYVCGPQRMTDDVVVNSKAAGMDESEVHIEAFNAVKTGDPFTVEIETPDGQCKKYDVQEEQTLLEVMRKAGFDVPSSCEVGNCGTCKVKVKSGQVEHRGSTLTEEDKANGEILSCVSRGIGNICVQMGDEEE